MATAKKQGTTKGALVPAQPTTSAGRGRTAPVAPAEPMGPKLPDMHYETPFWVAPDGVDPATLAPRIPQQLRREPEATVRPDDVPMEAHWVARHRMRTVLGVLLLVTVLATAGAAYVVKAQGVDGRLPLLAVPVVAILLLWARMATTTPTKIGLNGSVMTIKQHGRTDVFDLADPDVVVGTSAPGDPEWAACFDAVDGTPVTITERDFDGDKIAPVLSFYRHLAQRRMAERLERYHR